MNTSDDEWFVDWQKRTVEQMLLVRHAFNKAVVSSYKLGRIRGFVWGINFSVAVVIFWVWLFYA